VLTRRGGDHAIGRNLYRYFLAAGIPAPAGDAGPAGARGEAKTLAWSTLEATADAIISDGLANPGHVTAALARLRRSTDDPRTLTCGPRVFQPWSRR
jgi:hypothetical protein